MGFGVMLAGTVVLPMAISYGTTYLGKKVLNMDQSPDLSVWQRRACTVTGCALFAIAISAGIPAMLTASAGVGYAVMQVSILAADQFGLITWALEPMVILGLPAGMGHEWVPSGAFYKLSHYLGFVAFAISTMMIAKKFIKVAKEP